MELYWALSSVHPKGLAEVERVAHDVLCSSRFDPQHSTENCRTSSHACKRKEKMKEKNGKQERKIEDSRAIDQITLYSTIIHLMYVRVHFLCSEYAAVPCAGRYLDEVSRASAAMGFFPGPQDPVVSAHFVFQARKPFFRSEVRNISCVPHRPLTRLMAVRQCAYHKSN